MKKLLFVCSLILISCQKEEEVIVPEVPTIITKVSKMKSILK